MLEPFNLPGMVVVLRGVDKTLTVGVPPAGGGPTIFNLVAGLDGKAGSVSLESQSNKGCFVHNSMKLSCKSPSSGANSNQAASFVMEQGLSEYHPISFVAKWAMRNFLLQSLLNFQDEFYTVYFNIQA